MITVEHSHANFYHVHGMTNTAGEPEVYMVRVDDNGDFGVFVQRKGGFALLNKNVHYDRCNRVIATFKRLMA